MTVPGKPMRVMWKIPTVRCTFHAYTLHCITYMCALLVHYTSPNYKFLTYIFSYADSMANRRCIAQLKFQMHSKVGKKCSFENISSMEPSININHCPTVLGSGSSVSYRPSEEAPLTTGQLPIHVRSLFGNYLFQISLSDFSIVNFKQFWLNKKLKMFESNLIFKLK